VAYYLGPETLEVGLGRDSLKGTISKNEDARASEDDLVRQAILLHIFDDVLVLSSGLDPESGYIKLLGLLQDGEGDLWWGDHTYGGLSRFGQISESLDWRKPFDVSFLGVNRGDVLLPDLIPLEESVAVLGSVLGGTNDGEGGGREEEVLNLDGHAS